MSLRETNELLNEAVEQLDEYVGAVYAAVDGRGSLLGVDKDSSPLYDKFKLWYNDMYGMYMLKGVPKRLLDKIKQGKLLGAKGWDAVKRYVKKAEYYGDGIPDEKTLYKWQGVKK